MRPLQLAASFIWCALERKALRDFDLSQGRANGSFAKYGRYCPCTPRTRLVPGRQMDDDGSLSQALAILAVAGIGLIALLFSADALEPRSHSDTIQTLAASPAPRARQDLAGGTAAQPKSEPGALKKIGPAARAARAEVPSKNNRVTRSIGNRHNGLVNRLSIKGQ